MRQSLNTLSASDLAPTYEELSSYDIQENIYCSHNNKIYRSNNVIAARKAWDANDWSEIKLTAIIEQIRNEIDSVEYDTFNEESRGLVPASGTATGEKFLKDNGTWGTPEQYNLPTATADIKGGIKVGSGLNINSDGVVHIDVFDGTKNGLVNASGSNSNNFLAGDGTWKTLPIASKNT